MSEFPVVHDLLKVYTMKKQGRGVIILGQIKQGFCVIWEAMSWAGEGVGFGVREERKERGGGGRGGGMGRAG